jgi:hypothetical protein
MIRLFQLVLNDHSLVAAKVACQNVYRKVSDGLFAACHLQIEPKYLSNQIDILD